MTERGSRRARTGSRPDVRTLTLVGVATLASLAALAGPGAAAGTPAVARAAEAVAGAAGIGDRYFPLDGNGGYDVSHYAIDVRHRVGGGGLTGSTTIHAVARQRLSRFNLDLVLTADDVSVNGHPAASRQQGGHELVVTPDTPLPAGIPFTVTVDYHGRPAEPRYEDERPWIHSATETMATNEPHIAPWWFPANDHPRDKATFDISVSVPAGNQAFSNGVLQSVRTGEADPAGDTDTQWSTWRWSMDRPMAPYLAFFAAGSFRWEQGTAHGLPYVNAVSEQLNKRNRTEAMRLMRRTPGLVRWLEGLFGTYPFSSTGGVTTSVYSGFALENQSRPTYPFLGNNRYAVGVVVHELAHQWFGDLVSVDRWRDIWLNEGLASWAEWRYTEARGGQRAQKHLLQSYRVYPRQDPFWRREIGNPGPERLFGYAVYERGAMAAQALRHRIGNRAFMRLLHRWVADRADGTGRVGQFKTLAEEVSGEQLDRFFKVWLFTGAKPARTKANGLR